MSYNGIGLQTARGSATNGHIERSISSIKDSRKQDASSGHYSKRKLQESVAPRRLVHKEVSPEIREHERRRAIEVKCAELRDRLEEDDENSDEFVEAEVKALRLRLLDAVHQEAERKARALERSMLQDPSRYERYGYQLRADRSHSNAPSEAKPTPRATSRSRSPIRRAEATRTRD